jgi:hypothetical protein
VEGPTEGQPSVQPPAPSTVRAKNGDNISKLIGTSNPSALGAFGRANGMRPGDSTIYPGRTYVIPNDLSGPADQRQGLLMLDRDNSRLARLRMQREQAQAQRAEIPAAQDDNSFSPRDYRRAWLSEKAEPFEELLDRSPLVNHLVTGLVESVGRGEGAFRAAGKTAKGIKDFGDYITRPHPSLSDVRDAVSTDIDLLKFGNRVRKDWGLIPRAVEKKLDQMNVALNPSATARADSPLEELKRRYGIARNQGEPIYDVVSTLLPGSELRKVNGINRIREIARGPGIMKYGASSQAALNEPYPARAMGSHFPIGRALGRDLGIPKWIIDSPANVSRPPDLTKLEAYLYQAMVDRRFFGAKLPAGLDRKGFRFRDFDTDRFNTWERWLYGTPPASKAAVGGAAGAAIGAGRYSADDQGPE